MMGEVAVVEALAVMWVGSLRHMAEIAVAVVVAVSARVVRSLQGLVRVCSQMVPSASCRELCKRR